VSSRFDSFSTVGGIIGTSVSAAFLILLGLMNFYILYKLYKQMQKVLNLPEGQEDEAWKIEGGGVLFNVLKRMFKLINRFVVSPSDVQNDQLIRWLGLGRCTPWVSCSVLVSIPLPR
jgi:high-affinity nickel permease